MHKIKDWVFRYGPAELLAIAGAIIGGLAAHYLFGNFIVTALAGTWGDNIAYYGKIAWNDIRERRNKDGSLTPLGVLKVVRNAVVEFGPGEYLDAFLIRPAVLYFSISTIGNPALALFIGKISADVVFYIPTIIGYELRKKHLDD